MADLAEYGRQDAWASSKCKAFATSHAVGGGRIKQSMSFEPLGAFIPHPYDRSCPTTY